MICEELKTHSLLHNKSNCGRQSELRGFLIQSCFCCWTEASLVSIIAILPSNLYVEQQVLADAWASQVMRGDDQRFGVKDIFDSKNALYLMCPHCLARSAVAQWRWWWLWIKNPDHIHHPEYAVWQSSTHNSIYLQILYFLALWVHLNFRKGKKLIN